VLSSRSALYRAKSDFSNAFRDIADAIDRLERNGRAGTLNHLILKSNAISLLIGQGELANAQTYVDTLINMSGAEETALSPVALIRIAHVRGRRGDGAGAFQAINSAIRKADETNNVTAMSFSRFEQINLLLETQQIQPAKTLLGELEKRWHDLPRENGHLPIELLRAKVFLYDRDANEAIKAANAALAELQYPSKTTALGLHYVLRVAASAYLLANDIESAHRLASEAVAVSSRNAKDVRTSVDVGESWLIVARIARAENNNAIVKKALVNALPGFESNLSETHPLRREAIDSLTALKTQ
jgi:ATP/maltotriose-dependent transcriptional regulator MalT